MLNKLKDQYFSNGFLKIKLLNSNEFKQIKFIVLKKVYNLLELDKYTNSNISYKNFNWSKYHFYVDRFKLKHDSILTGKNRHFNKNEFKNTILKKKNILNFFQNIVEKKLMFWNEGLGEFAFRIIRPNHNDGYPWSCKKWGPAKNVVSIWLPIISFKNPHTIALWPFSHKKKLSKYKPSSSKFEKKEFRLMKSPPINEVLRPNLTKGEIIFFHQKLQHSENVINGNNTRINLEFRLKIIDG